MKQRRRLRVKTHTARINIIILPDIRQQLQELAAIDIDKFLRLTGQDIIVQFTVCSEHEKGKSMQAIANKLKLMGVAMTREAVHARCKKCEA